MLNLVMKIKVINKKHSAFVDSCFEFQMAEVNRATETCIKGQQACPPKKSLAVAEAQSGYEISGLPFFPC